MQSICQIPFGLRQKHDGKFDELLKEGITEAVPEGPTGWKSPLVVVPLLAGDIHVCLDMRLANQAMSREW